MRGYGPSEIKAIRRFLKEGQQQLREELRKLRSRYEEAPDGTTRMEHRQAKLLLDYLRYLEYVLTEDEDE